MKFRTIDKCFEDVKLSVTKHRNRIGCDICKKDCPTECFMGWCGNVLWICGRCFKKITTNKKDANTKKKGCGKRTKQGYCGMVDEIKKDGQIIKSYCKDCQEVAQTKDGGKK